MANHKEKVTKAAADKGSLVEFSMFVAWVGALVYFVSRADGFWDIIVAFFKACVWPAYLLYYAFQALGVS